MTITPAGFSPVSLLPEETGRQFNFGTKDRNSGLGFAQEFRAAHQAEQSPAAHSAPPNTAADSSKAADKPSDASKPDDPQTRDTSSRQKTNETASSGTADSAGASSAKTDPAQKARKQEDPEASAAPPIPLASSIGQPNVLPLEWHLQLPSEADARAGANFGQPAGKGAEAPTDLAQSTIPTQSAVPAEAANAQLADANLAFAARLLPQTDVAASESPVPGQAVAAANAAGSADSAQPESSKPEPLSPAQITAQIQSNKEPRPVVNSQSFGGSDPKDLSSKEKGSENTSAREPGAIRPQFETTASFQAVMKAGETGATQASKTTPSAGTNGPAVGELEVRDVNRPATEPVRDISLQLSGNRQENVEVRLVDRAGELHVAVRTPDAELTRGLRDNLSDLVGHLERNGYVTETWRPAESGFSSADLNHRQSNGSEAFPKSRDGNQSGSGGSQENGHGQNQNDNQQPRWVEEMESSLNVGPALRRN